MHIAAQVVMDEARTPEIDHLDLTSRIGLDQNVLWLEIAVDKAEAVNEIQSCQYLLSDSLEATDIEVLFLFDLTVVLAVFIKIIPQ